jgi:hypothetical protein
MPVREIPITSLGELIDHVTPSDADPVTGRRRDSGVYRGMACAQWRLLTSLDRLGGVAPPHTKVDLEEHILRNFIRYSRPYFPAPPVNEWELLVAAQHHGLPTRLLDWTYSPLVAAHFATLERRTPECDRVVWRLDWKAVHRHFGFPELALLIRDLGELASRFGVDERRRNELFTPWTLFRAHGDGAPFACMLEPPSLDARIVAQSAAFTLCADSARPFDCFLEEQGLGDVLTRFVIPRAEVPRLRDQLDLASVDERRLFPDLDGVTAQLRRYYS